MSGEGVTRQLKAILAADVVGYSRLMDIDEAGPTLTLPRKRGDMSEHRTQTTISPPHRVRGLRGGGAYA